MQRIDHKICFRDLLIFNLVAETPAPTQKATNVEIPVHERKKKNSCEFEKVSAVKCKVCNDLFIELSDLKRHHNLVHEENEPLKDVEDYLKF